MDVAPCECSTTPFCNVTLSALNNTLMDLVAEQEQLMSRLTNDQQWGNLLTKEQRLENLFNTQQQQDNLTMKIQQVKNMLTYCFPNWYPQQQQAAGTTVFWALLAIAVNCMLQPSFSGYLMSGGLFHGTLWPHRSSPAYCLVDTVVDLRLIARRYRKTSVPRPKVEPARSTTVALRLAVFIIGVVPQALQLFSISGVPLSQALAAVYLVSTLVSMVRALHLEDADKEAADLVAAIPRTTGDDPYWNFSRIEGLVGMGPLVPHCVYLYRTWQAIDRKAAITVPDSVVSVVDDVFTYGGFLITLYMLHYACWYVVMSKPSPVRGQPVILLMGLAQTTNFKKILRSPSARYRKEVGGLCMMVHAALCCCAVAFGLCFCVERGRAFIKSKRGSGSPLEEANITHPASTNDVELVDDSLRGQQTPDALPEEADVTDALLPTNPTPQESHIPVALMRPTEGATELEVRDHSTPAEHVPPQDSVATLDGTSGDSAMTASKPRLLYKQARAALLELLGNAAIGVAVAVGVIIFIPLIYTGLFDIASRDSEADQQAANEEGRNEQEAPPGQDAGPVCKLWHLMIRDAPESPPPTRNEVLWLLVQVVNLPFQLMLKIALQVLWRFGASSCGLYQFVLKWFWKKVEPRSKDVLWIAFGVLNLVTAAIYYLCIFDGRGTYSPSWTDVFN